MNITKNFISKAGGPRSPMVRHAMVRAGDKRRVDALKKFLISVGACEISPEEIDALGLTIREKKFSFSPVPLIYALLDENNFSRFKPLKSAADLEASRIRNGVIGIRDTRS